MSCRLSLAFRRFPLRGTRAAANTTKFLNLRTMATQHASYENILVSRPGPAVQLITLNRPKALNALSSPLYLELNDALENADKDSDIRAIVLTGSDKAFAGMYVILRPGCRNMQNDNRCSWCRHQGNERQRM
jgi:enoyl-CoA hydratase